MTVESSTLLSRLEAAADRGGTVTFVGVGDGPDALDRLTWAQLHDEARATAAALQALGIEPGVHVGLLGSTSRAFVTAVQAVWCAGATVVVLPLPMRLGSIEEFVAQTRARIQSASCALVIVDPQLAEFLDPRPGDPPTVLLHELVGAGPAAGYRRPADDPDALAVLQFTSGSTADPKGVMLPHRCITANLDGCATAAEFDPELDTIVSWLPLYHDMGLIGTLAYPMATGTDLVLAAPQDFLAAPARWMEWIHRFGGTITAGPNFSWALAARALRRLDTLDLSRLRLALNGAEPVDPDTADAFCDAGARHGLDSRCVFPAFGMAEVVIGCTFPEPMTGLRVDTVDRRVLDTEHYAAAASETDPNPRRLALLGRAVPGLEIRVCDPVTGDVLGEREAGELEIRGSSVTPGYYRHEQATADAFHDGWLRTGDLAYLVDAELVICGRLKDVIIIGGRNVFPEDVERAAAAIGGVRAGNVIAFGTEGRRGREALVVVAETKEGDPHAIRESVHERVTAVVGVPPEEIVLVRPGTLPKTSSGKLQRYLCKARWQSAQLEPCSSSERS